MDEPALVRAAAFRARTASACAGVYQRRVAASYTLRRQVARGANGMSVSSPKRVAGS
jgi:hypothetical protein